jgi:hypothetical protein
MQALRDSTSSEFKACGDAIKENAMQIALTNQATTATNESVKDLVSTIRENGKKTGAQTEQIKKLLLEPDKGVCSRVTRLESFSGRIQKTLGRLWGLTVAIVVAAITVLGTLLFDHFANHD